METTGKDRQVTKNIGGRHGGIYPGLVQVPHRVPLADDAVCFKL